MSIFHDKSSVRFSCCECIAIPFSLISKHQILHDVLFANTFPELCGKHHALKCTMTEPVKNKIWSECWVITENNNYCLWNDKLFLECNRIEGLGSLVVLCFKWYWSIKVLLCCVFSWTTIQFEIPLRCYLENSYKSFIACFQKRNKLPAITDLREWC